MPMSVGCERNGRRLRTSSFAGPFATAAAITIATMPRPAALRPFLPPHTDIPQARRSHSRE